MSSSGGQSSEIKQGRPGRLKWVAAGVIVLLVLVAGAVLVYSPGRAKSQITSTIVVHTPGLYGQQVVADGSILNSSLSFNSGDKIGVKIVLMYTPFPGDPNSLKIVSVNESDGLSVASVSPSLPTTLTGSPRGLAMTVILVAPTSSYSGDLHLNVVFSVPPPPA